MALTADQLASRIDALETALAREERTVQFADRSVTYSSTAEIEQRLNYFQRQLRELNGGRRKQTLAVASKGL